MMCVCVCVCLFVYMHSQPLLGIFVVAVVGGGVVGLSIVWYSKSNLCSCIPNQHIVVLWFVYCLVCVRTDAVCALTVSRNTSETLCFLFICVAVTCCCGCIAQPTSVASD